MMWSVSLEGMTQLLGIDKVFVENQRYWCRVCASLYRNHFIYIEPLESWTYIGSLTPAFALGQVANQLPSSTEIDDEEWKDIEGR